MHEVIGLRPDLQRLVLNGTVELSKKHFSDLKPLRGRDRANHVKGVQKWRHRLVGFRIRSAASLPATSWRDVDGIVLRCFGSELFSRRVRRLPELAIPALIGRAGFSARHPAVRGNICPGA